MGGLSAEPAFDRVFGRLFLTLERASFELKNKNRSRIAGSARCGPVATSTAVSLSPLLARFVCCDSKSGMMHPKKKTEE